MHGKVGGQTTLIDPAVPALKKVGGQLTPLTPCFRGLCTEALDRLRVHSNMYLVLMSILICVHITATVQNSSNMVVVEASVHAPTTPVQSTPTSLMSTRTVVAQTPCVPPPSSSSRLCQRSVGETANFCCSIIYLYLYLSLLLWPRHGQYCLPTQNV